jgi:hypothetical protein
VNTDGKWRVIVNGVKYNYETLTQTARIEECTTAGSACPLGAASQHVGRRDWSGRVGEAAARHPVLQAAPPSRRHRAVRMAL